MKEGKMMPPLWLAYPEIERYSIGWRMVMGKIICLSFLTGWTLFLGRK